MKLRTTDILAVLLIGYLVASNWGDLPDVIAPSKPVDAVTYVYDKNDGGVPAVVHAGIDKLGEREGMVATVHEYEGTGDTPEQYKIPEAEAKKAGMPALVATADGEVVRVVSGRPTTVEQVLEVAR